MSIYEKTCRVDCSDIGEKKEFLNLAFLKKMQNIASIHSEEIEQIIGKIKEKNIGWVITNWKLQVKERPKENEEIKIKTWIRKMNKLYFYRDFEVYNELGKCIAKAESKWIWLNLEDRSIVRVDDEIRKRHEEIIENREVFSEEKTKVEYKNSYEDYAYGTEYKIVERDIDSNNHVNNLNYLCFANGAVSDSLDREGEANNIEITYKRELLLGDTIECLYKKTNKNEYDVIIQNKKTKEANAFIKYVY